MAWVNVFDVGECDVLVVDQNTGVELDESDWPTFGIDAIRVEGGTVHVDGNPFGYIAIMVRPSFDTEGRAVRVRDMLTERQGWRIANAMIVSGEPGNIVDEVYVDRVGDAYTPDPAEMHPYEAGWSWTDAGVVCEGGG